jgi:hypothetical protein
LAALTGRGDPGQLFRVGRLLRRGGPPATTALASRPDSTGKLTILIPSKGHTGHSQNPEVRLGFKVPGSSPRPAAASDPTRATSTCWSTASWSA